MTLKCHENKDQIKQSDSALTHRRHASIIGNILNILKIREHYDQGFNDLLLFSKSKIQSQKSKVKKIAFLI